MPNGLEEPHPGGRRIEPAAVLIRLGSASFLMGVALAVAVAALAAWYLFAARAAAMRREEMEVLIRDR